MATEKQQTIPEENASEVPSDSKLFARDVQEELSEREVFAGDEDFYKFLADSVRPAATPSRRGGTKASRPRPMPILHIHRRFSSLQKGLVVGIVLLGAMLFYALLKSPSEPVTGTASTPAIQQTPHPEPPVEGSAQVARQRIQETKTAISPTEALSLEVAETFYLQKDYDKAYAAYNQLRQSLPTDAEGGLLRDFLQLRKASCMKKTGDIDHVDSLFRTVLQSRSPVVRVVANYHLSLLETQKKQYLKARTRAYQTIALTGAVDFDRDWALSLERNCHFLVAEFMTKNVLSLCDGDKDLPEELWTGSLELDPFTNLSEAQLRSFLSSGSEQLGRGLLGPQIQELKRQGMLPRWSVVCHRASIGELLARFAANVGLDIHWARRSEPDLRETEDAIRKRPVSLYLPAATAQQVVTVAAGCAGLLAQLDDKGTANICNPADYSSLSEHISLLSQEAVSVWQRFLLTFHSDERVANAHFALGLLQAQKGQVIDAIAEYKLVANRFSQTSLAPFALLHSSKLKTNLRDYPGARQDLKQLIEQYPDSVLADRACLYLADATMKAQLYGEAARLYRKVYNLGLSLESQAAAALGAGKCYYERKNTQEAAKWLNRHIDLANNRPSKDLCSAYLLLGKTNLALGKYEQACEAFQYALAGQLTREEYVETVSALVEGYMEQERFVEALNILENIRSWQFSQRESIEILLLKSKVLCAVGLVDKAIAALGDRAEYISDSQLKANVSFELAKCYIAKGNLELAHRSLTEILVLAEAGPLAHKVACELADVCLKLGQNSQAVSICSQLLDLAPSAQIKQRALSILATAYSRQKDYDGAALALLGRWNGTETANTKTRSVDTSVKGDAPLDESQ